MQGFRPLLRHVAFQTMPRISYRGLSTSSGSLRAMVFIDGSWLFQSFFKQSGSIMRTRIGERWEETHRVLWSRLPLLATEALSKQMKMRGDMREVSVVGTKAFTSSNEDGTAPVTEGFVSSLQGAGFDLEVFGRVGHQEKCVDIAMATEMLYQGFIGGYDVAIVLTGDLDFAPAMRRVRDQGKLVALLSIPRYCSVLLTSAPTSTDYTVLLTPLLDDLIIENDSQKYRDERPTSHQNLKHYADVAESILQTERHPLSSAELVGIMAKTPTCKDIHPSLLLDAARAYPSKFEISYPDTFTVGLVESRIRRKRKGPITGSDSE